MRLTTVILIATLMQVSATSLAQKFTYSKQGASLEMIFKEIKNQTGYNVFYSTQNIDISKKLNVNFANEDLINVLKQCITDQNLQYSIDNKNIIINPKTPSFLDLPKLAFANVDARGRILDEAGKPLEGATVVLKGTNRTVKTDVKGEFVLANVPDDGVLVIRYVGFKTLEISLKDAVMPLEIKLNVATGELEEVNVTYSTGYQNIPKERATGSFVQIDKELINRSPAPRLLDRILNLTNSLKFEPLPVGTDANNNTNITIRGFSTINANMRPLIVVDGFPYEEFDKGLDNQLSNNILNNINPNDIESITILRDAAAASIWGARAGNGVIVITTKRGKLNQKPNVNFTTSLNLTDKPNLWKEKIISSKDMIDFEKNRFASGFYNQYDDVYPSSKNFPSLPLAIETLLAKRRGEISSQEAEDRLNELSNHDVREDIDKYFLQKQVEQQYNINISGGGDRMTYYTSIGYDGNRSNNKGVSDKRYTFRLENTYKLTRNLDIGAYITYTNSQTQDNGFDYRRLLASGGGIASPYAQLADKNGVALHVPTNSTYRVAYIDTLKLPGLLDWHYKPLNEQKFLNNSVNMSSTRVGGDIRYKPFPYLSFNIKGQYIKNQNNIKTIASLDQYESRDLVNRFMYYDVSGVAQYPFPKGSRLKSTFNDNTSWNLRVQMNVDKSWEKHSVTGILGAELSEVTRNIALSTLYGYDDDKSIFNNTLNFNTPYNLRPNGIGTLPSDGRIDGFLTRFINYFGNLGYTFLQRYTLTASGRIDASNFFGSKSNNRQTPLYSTGIAWDISQEPFYRIKWLQALKLRATFGYNANMNNRATALPTGTYTTSDNGLLHTEPTFKLNTPGNPTFTWEKIRNINLGLDFEMFNRRIGGSIELYTKKGINLIGQIITEPTTGFTEYTGNYANMKGSGIDISLRTVNIRSVFTWNTVLNFSSNSDKITKYLISDNSKNSAQYYLLGNATIEGKPIFKTYAYPYAGLDPLNGDPRGHINNLPVDFTSFLSQVKPSDLKYFGARTPRYFGSILNTFTYKVISISCNITYRIGYYVNKQSIVYGTMFNNWGGHLDYTYRWQVSGDELITNIPSLPKVTNPARDNFFSSSEYNIIKGDHIRLNDIRISADLTKSIFHLKQNRSFGIYIYANNIGLIWKANRFNIDPDYASSGANSPIRSIAFGLTLGL